MVRKNNFLKLVFFVVFIFHPFMAIAMDENGDASSLSNKSLLDFSNKIRIIPNGILHLNNKINALVITQSSLVQVSISCGANEAYWNYIMAPKRIYPNGKDQYSLPKRLDDNSTLILKSSPEIFKICSTKTDWRVLRPIERRKNSPGIIIDINSIYKTRQGDVVVWVASDDPLIAYDIPYQAPYGSKYEQYLIDCSSKKVAQLAGYDVDDKFRVTDGIVMNRVQFQALHTEDHYYSTIEKAVCQPTKRLSDKPIFSPTKKSIVNTKELRTISPEVLKEIHSYNLKKPNKQIKQYEIKGVSTADSESSSPNDTIIVSPTKTVGVWRVTTKNKNENYDNTELSFLGLIRLSSKTDYKDGSSDNTLISNLVLKGDWKNMPVGSEISYQNTMDFISNVTGEYYDKPELMICSVKNEILASSIYPSLSGDAKVISCQGSQDKNRSLRTSFFLEDYGFFINKYENDEIKNLIGVSN